MIGALGEELYELVNVTWSHNWGSETLDQAMWIITQWKYRRISKSEALKRLRVLKEKAMYLDAQEAGEASEV